MPINTRRVSNLIESKDTEQTPRKQRKVEDDVKLTPRRSSRIRTPTVKLMNSLIETSVRRSARNTKRKSSTSETSSDEESVDNDDDDDDDISATRENTNSSKIKPGKLKNTQTPTVKLKNSVTDSSLRKSSRKSKHKNLTSEPNSDLESIENDDDFATTENTNTSKFTPGKLSSDMQMMSISDSEDSNFKIKETCKKTLFDAQDVLGKKMFGFQTPKKRGSMVQRAMEVVNSPIDHRTPSSKKSALPEKTPHIIRSKLKKELAALIEESASDFSDSEDEYKPSGSSSESESSSEEDESNQDVKKITETVNLLKDLKVSNPTRKSKRDLTYIMKTDDYFTQVSNKILTSNHTLQRLKNPKLSEEQLEDLLASLSNLAKDHEICINSLYKEGCGYFNKWLSILDEGFNVVLYGLGSKRSVLELFQKKLENSGFPVIVVNGYFPSLTIKDVVDSIAVDILGKTECSNVFESVNIIEETFTSIPELHLYLIVNNIDGTMLRNSKSQNVLSSLASIRNVHLVASIDHINTPLIWDHSKLSKFNFTWWDTTMFLTYTDETSFEGSLLVQRSGALTLSSLSSVYQSLTKNSRGVFMLIINYQLANKSVKHYQGMPFKVLYSKSRENFLVSSDLALRAQLTEFLDHKLVRSRRSADGTEQLVVPINNSILQQFAEQHSAEE